MNAIKNIVTNIQIIWLSVKIGYLAEMANPVGYRD